MAIRQRMRSESEQANLMSKHAKWLAMAVMTLSAALAKAELVVDSGYVRASLPGSTTTSAYMTLSNPADADVLITGVTTRAAAKVSFHSTMNHDGMMHMMDLESLKIAARKSLVLEPGGMHLMLENTAAALLAGRRIELVLQFADGRKQSISLPVQSVLADQH
jgi:copper(I)-binding protein